MATSQPILNPIKVKGVGLACLNDQDTQTRVLVGPVGSGKSSIASYELARMAFNTPPCSDGVSRSRSIIIRNTYRELNDSCIRTWWQWVPQSLGHWSSGDTSFTINIPGFCHHIFYFRAIDTANDIGKLLSTEYSYAWLSEARELPEELIQMLPARLRYPSRKMVPTFKGRIIIESNPSDKSHWLYHLAAELKPIGWKLYQQPSGLSKEAENIENLPINYYENLCHGRPQNWIDCFINGKWAYVSGDLPVFGEYNDNRNASEEELKVIPGQPVIVGMDFGLTPAAVFIQHINGQYRVLDELVTENMGAKRFGAEVAKLLKTKYNNCEPECWGDPAGSGRSQSDETTPYQMLASEGVYASPTYTNDFSVRREAVAGLCLGTTMMGTPTLIVSSTCKVLRRGLGGDYKYNRIQVSGTARYTETPNKSSSSHICDALGYALLGAGEGHKVFGNQWDKKMENRLEKWQGRNTTNEMRGYRR